MACIEVMKLLMKLFYFSLSLIKTYFLGWKIFFKNWNTSWKWNMIRNELPVWMDMMIIEFFQPMS